VADDKSRGDAPTLGTIQVPRGAKLEDFAGGAPTAAPSSTSPIQVGAPPAMPPESRYQVKSEIARGGMGRVVEANDSVLGRTVAVKEALAHDPESIRRFERETRITARLEHPSIVPVHDAGTLPDGSPFYVMRKVSGQPLEELVAKAEKLPDRLALLGHVVAAANAVAHAHERGVVHRDIKPANILVGDLGETVLIDWGLAKAIGEAEDSRAAPVARVVDADDNVKTRAGVVFGTPGFMAPEQLRGEPADEKCDVYALGATLYHLLARRPPHYSKDPDEMMRSAANGPPRPLHELLPGVPPEIGTIIDKALAHDRAARYPDARALAEDLQRFLTGQLVASHHYSRREKLARFVRKNRALVGVSAAAALAMVVGGTIAVTRIMHERDRADDQRRIAEDQERIAKEQKDKVTDSLQKLTLASARTKTGDDPTRAVAMVAQLATESSWRQARAIGAAARAHGVAFGMPASARVLSLEMSRDGQRVLAAGDDGMVRVYDLAKRTTKTVAEVGAPATARFADGERALVVAHGDRLVIVDVAASKQREVTTRAPIAQLAVSGPIAYWTDKRGELWKLDATAGALPEQVTLAEKAGALAASPDGRWIAVSGESHLLVLDRTQPTLPPQQIGDAAPRDVAWSSDGSHGAALLGEEVIAFEMPSGLIVHRQFVGGRTAAAYIHGQVVASGPTGVSTIAKGDARAHHLDGAYTLGLHEARGGIVVTGSAQGVVAVMAPDDDDQILRAPGMQLSGVEASPSSPWIVAAGDGQLLVWNVDAIEPQRIGDAVSDARFVGGDAVIAAYSDGPAQWIDLRTAKSTPIGAINGGVRAIVPAPDGTRAVVIDGTHRGMLMSQAAPPSELGELEFAAFADDQRLVVAATDGKVRVGERVLFQHPEVRALAARGDHVAASFAGTIWRQSLSASKSEQTDVAQPTPALAVAPTGDVLYGSGTELRVWRADGTRAVLATYDKKVTEIALADGRILALCEDGTLHVAESKAPALAAASGSVAASGLVAAISGDGGIEVVDPLAQPGEAWTLAAPRGRTFSHPQIAPDGSRVLARTPTSVLVWPLALPPTRDATAAWLDVLTNAIANPDGTIRWK
jgi:serine/threonine protein kinase/WD40 repeat protein